MLFAAFATIGTNGGIQNITNTSLNDAYIPLSCNVPDTNSQVPIPRQESMSKEYANF